MPEPCHYQGLVGREQTDAAGVLSLAAAAAIVADALQALAAATADSSATAPPTTLAATSVLLRPVAADAAAAPRGGELVRCGFEPPSVAQPGRLVGHITGPRGVAWSVELQLASPLPVVHDAAATVAQMPPMRLMRPMRARDCDQAGHVNVQVFMDLADEATQALLADVPGDAPALQIAQVRIGFKRELFRGDLVTVHSGVRQVGAQGAELVHGIVHQASGALACTIETRLTPATGAALADPAALEGLQRLVQDWPGLPAARAPALPRAAAAPADNAVVTAMAVVDAWDCDAAGRLTLRALVNLCSTGARQYLATVGLTGARFLRDQITVAAVDYLIEITRRPALGSNLTLRSALLAGSAKSIRFTHHLVDSDDGTVYATVEIVGVMLDLAAHRSMEIPGDVKQRLGLA